METSVAPSALTPDPQAWAALRASAIVVPLARVGSLRVSGPDREQFLNGQLARDIVKLEVGGALRSAYLDVRGHALAEMQVLKREHELQLAVEDGGSAEVARRLLAHRVFDDVEVGDLTGATATLTVQGPDAGTVVRTALQLPALEEGRFATAAFDGAEVLAIRNRRTVPGGADLHVPAGLLESLMRELASAGASVGDEASLEASRVEAGLARAGCEAGSGVLPQEAGLVAAISTRKGCYLGQEVMARIEARARLRRSLRTLRLESLPTGASPGQPLLRAGRTVGRVGTVAVHPELGPLALAVVRDDVEAGESLLVGEVAAAILPA